MHHPCIHRSPGPPRVGAARVTRAAPDPGKEPAEGSPGGRAPAADRGGASCARLQSLGAAPLVTIWCAWSVGAPQHVHRTYRGSRGAAFWIGDDGGPRRPDKVGARDRAAGAGGVQASVSLHLEPAHGRRRRRGAPRAGERRTAARPRARRRPAAREARQGEKKSSRQRAARAPRESEPKRAARAATVAARRRGERESTPREPRLHPVTTQGRPRAALHDLHVLLAEARADGQGCRKTAR